MNRAAGLLAASVLADSAIEHYRGSFENHAMYMPLVTAALASRSAATASPIGGRRACSSRRSLCARRLTGLVGTGFHIYNVIKRPGGMSWQNLFYGAPLGAPMALLLSGLLGFTAERVRDSRPATPRMFGLPAGRGRWR